MSKYSWDNSKCKGIWLHRFKISEQYEEAVKETCEICGKSKVFKTANGRPNNLEYIAYHVRQLLIPQQSLYSHEYKRNK